MQKSASSLQQSISVRSSRVVRASVVPHNSEVPVKIQPSRVSVKSRRPSKEKLGQGLVRKKSGIDCRNLLPTNSQLLKDLVKIFKLQKTPYIRTRDLIAGLCADPSKPWASYFRGSNITARQLSGLLKPYGVSSCCIYYKEGNAKGYNCQSVRRAYRSANVDKRSH
jgi:hypothetical protein